MEFLNSSVMTVFVKILYPLVSNGYNKDGVLNFKEEVVGVSYDCMFMHICPSTFHKLTCQRDNVCGLRKSYSKCRE